MIKNKLHYLGPDLGPLCGNNTSTLSHSYSNTMEGVTCLSCINTLRKEGYDCQSWQTISKESTWAFNESAKGYMTSMMLSGRNFVEIHNKIRQTDPAGGKHISMQSVRMACNQLKASKTDLAFVCVGDTFNFDLRSLVDLYNNHNIASHVSKKFGITDTVMYRLLDKAVSKGIPVNWKVKGTAPTNDAVTTSPRHSAIAVSSVSHKGSWVLALPDINGGPSIHSIVGRGESPEEAYADATHNIHAGVIEARLRAGHIVLAKLVPVPFEFKLIPQFTIKED